MVDRMTSNSRITIEDDLAINRRFEDLLGRRNFAERVADKLINNDSNKNLVIGITGKWGSGKSSITNMILDHIDQEYIKPRWCDEESKPIIIRFNPWNFSEQNQLIALFFKELIIKLKKTNYDNLKVVSEKLELYVSILEPTSTIFPPMGILLKLIKHTSKAIKNLANYKLNDLEGTKNELENSLKNQHHKIIISIEDIDRLNNLEIWQIFQLVKLLANFPNTVYLLEFDRDVVAKSLDNLNYGYPEDVSGTAYLEKIVQIMFEVPLITEREIEIFFQEMLTNIVGDMQNRERKYFYKLYNEFLKYFFNNLRDLKRFFNTFSFVFDNKEDICISDCVAMTVIHIFIPDLYRYIQKNRYLFAITKKSPYEYLNDDKEKLKNQLNNFIKELNLNIPEYEEKLLNFLKIIFPKLNILYGSVEYYNYSFLGRWLPEKRICIEDNFDTYFRFSVPEWALSQKEFMSLLKISDTHKFIDSFLNIADGKKDKYLKELDFNIRFKGLKLDENVKITIIKGLIQIGDLLYTGYDYEMSPDLRIYTICTTLIKSMDNGFKILKNAILSSKSIYTISYITEHVLEALEDDSKDIGMENIVLTDVQIKELKNITSQKIQDILRSCNLGEVHNPILILHRWVKIEGEDKVKEFTNSISDRSVIGLILDFVNIEDSLKNNKIEWRYNFEGFIKEIMDVKVFECKINSLDITKLDKRELFFVEKIKKYLNNIIKEETKKETFIGSITREINNI